MKALIFENKVVQLTESEFPVSSSMQWQDCDDSVQVGYFFIDDQFKETNLSDADFLEQQKSKKLKELDDYHFNSPEIREMKINDYFILSLSGNGRNLIVEQIQNLEQKIQLNITTTEEAIFEYFYNGGSIEINLLQLKQLYTFMLNVVNTNYGIYKNYIHEIKNLSTTEEVKAYNFTANYLKNQNLNIE